MNATITCKGLTRTEVLRMSFLSNFEGIQLTQHARLLQTTFFAQGVHLAYLQTRISRVFSWILSLYFFGYWSQMLYFLGSQINAVFLSALYFKHYRLVFSFIQQVLQSAQFFFIIISCLTFTK